MVGRTSSNGDVDTAKLYSSYEMVGLSINIVYCVGKQFLNNLSNVG